MVASPQLPVRYVGDAFIFAYTLYNPLPDGSGPDVNNPVVLSGSMSAELYGAYDVVPFMTTGTTTDSDTDLAHGKFKFVFASGANGTAKIRLAETGSYLDASQLPRVAVIQTDAQGYVTTLAVQQLDVRRR